MNKLEEAQAYIDQSYNFEEEIPAARDDGVQAGLERASERSMLRSLALSNLVLAEQTKRLADLLDSLILTSAEDTRGRTFRYINIQTRPAAGG